MVYPKVGVIPIGVYVISNISCIFENVSHPRVLKLKATTRASNSGFFESYYSDLYIYPESEDDSGDFLYTMGSNGIVASIVTRESLTIGDTITVTTSGCAYDISKCKIYPFPEIGTVVTQQSSSGYNEFIFKFVNWGNSVDMDVGSFVYKVCIEVSAHECVEVCEDNSVVSESGMLCNRKNVKHLGELNSGGKFPIQYKAKFKGANDGF